MRISLRGLRTRRGASAVEFGLILGLIALAALGATTLLGERTAALFCEVGGRLGAANTCAQEAPAETGSFLVDEPAEQRAQFAAALTQMGLLNAAPENGIALLVPMASTEGEVGACVPHGIRNTGTVALDGFQLNSTAVELCDGPMVANFNFPAFDALAPCAAPLPPGQSCAIGVRFTASAPSGQLLAVATLSARQGASEQVALNGLVQRTAQIGSIADFTILAGDTLAAAATFTVDGLANAASTYGNVVMAADRVYTCCGLGVSHADGIWSIDANGAGGMQDVGTHEMVVQLNDYSNGVTGVSAPFTVTVTPGRLLSTDRFAAFPREARLTAEAIFAGDGVVGETDACALLPGGVPQCAGTVSAPPAAMASGVTRIAISNLGHGDSAACGIRSGAVGCWGNSAAIGTVPARLSSGVTDIAGGRYGFCAIDDGAAVCWSPSQTRIVPASVASGMTGIAMGRRASCGIRNGQAVCWSESDTVYPVPALSGVTAIGVTTDMQNYDGTERETVCALAGGSVSCWGYAFGWNGNSFGLANTVQGSDVTFPILDIPPAAQSGASSLSVGGAQACVLKGGTPICWGDLKYGEGDLPQNLTYSAVVAGRGFSLGLVAE